MIQINLEPEMTTVLEKITYERNTDHTSTNMWGVKKLGIQDEKEFEQHYKRQSSWCYFFLGGNSEWLPDLLVEEERYFIRELGESPCIAGGRSVILWRSPELNSKGAKLEMPDEEVEWDCMLLKEENADSLDWNWWDAAPCSLGDASGGNGWPAASSPGRDRSCEESRRTSGRLFWGSGVDRSVCRISEMETVCCEGPWEKGSRLSPSLPSVW